MSRVFLLGSGFSVAAGAPLSRDVLGKIFSNNSKTGEVAQLETWLDDHLFHKHPHGCRQADFEEVISRLELFEHFSEQDSKNKRELEQKISILLTEFIRLLQPEQLQESLDCYDYFARKLLPNDVIITFNYDLVMERALERNQLGVNYHLFLTGSPFNPNQKNHRNKTYIPVLKLHGSINLVFCTKCYHIQQAFSSNMLCTKCRFTTLPGERPALRPFLIAPTLFKSYTLPDLRRIWHTAYKYLSMAKELVIIGYSLPDADILTAQLLDFAHRSCSHNPKVTVANGPHPDLSRLESIYTHGVNNTCLPFADWVKLIK